MQEQVLLANGILKEFIMYYRIKLAPVALEAVAR
jgi:hypothetical protein